MIYHPKAFIRGKGLSIEPDLACLKNPFELQRRRRPRHIEALHFLERGLKGASRPRFQITVHTSQLYDLFIELTSYFVPAALLFGSPVPVHQLLAPGFHRDVGPVEVLLLSLASNNDL